MAVCGPASKFEVGSQTAWYWFIELVVLLSLIDNAVRSKIHTSFITACEATRE